jgi:putative membrane protein
MNRSIILTAAMIAALTACKQTVVVENNTASAAGTTANMVVNNAGIEGATTNTGAIDTAFLTDAMKGDNSEVALGNLAQQGGTSKGVKDLGKMLVTDHGAHKQQLAALAQQLGVPVAGDLKDEAKVEQTKLNALSGAAFDKEFVRATVEDHQKDIAAYEAQAKGTGPVADMAKQTLPVLKKHLAAAEALQK